MRVRIALLAVAVIFCSWYPGVSVRAESVNVTAQPISYKSRLFFSPRTYNVTVDSEFDASLFLDTGGFSVNTLDLQVTFPANLVSVVRPSGGESLVSLWVTPPSYSNSRGTMDFSGIILGGAKTSSGLIEKVTFRAKSPGTGVITIKKTSRVLINDGFGTETEVETIPLRITIEPKAPEGIVVYSSTHPFQGEWSNNKNPVFSWEKKDGEVFSYMLDDKPFTAPDDELEGEDTQVGYENIKDGIWYFHIKSKMGKIWSSPTHYAVRIDTTPPAKFTPTMDMITSSEKSPAIISFFSTDALSGIARYEVGVLDASAAPDTLPGFIQSESPYYMPKQNSGTMLVTVRAVDRAGNVRDETITVRILPPFFSFAQRNSTSIIVLGSLLMLLLGSSMIVYTYRRNRRKPIRPDEMRDFLQYAAERGYLPPSTYKPTRTVSPINRSLEEPLPHLISKSKPEPEKEAVHTLQ